MERSCQDKNNPIKIAIVGGGPSGIYCAINLGDLFQKNNFINYSVDIFDKSQVLRTLLPTGNGRCNITNNIFDTKEFASNYPRGEKFLYSVFARYFIPETLDFFRSIGVETYIQNDNRIFPKSNSSADVKAKMLNKLWSYKNIKLIHKAIFDYGELSGYDKIVISVGSKNTQNFLKTTGHEIIPFKKALCALKIKDFKYPKGVSVQSSDGDFVFTENGISGPLAFKISSLNSRKDFPYDITINLFNLDDIKKEILKNTKKSIGNIVSCFIPRSLAHIIVNNFDKKASEVSNKELESYTKLDLTVISTEPTGEIVNSGGINLNELDKNYKSKIKNNLWFIGEAVDVDGFCGGFNLQHCWSSAYIAACDIIKSVLN